MNSEKRQRELKKKQISYSSSVFSISNAESSDQPKHWNFQIFESGISNLIYFYKIFTWKIDLIHIHHLKTKMNSQKGNKNLKKIQI